MLELSTSLRLTLLSLAVCCVGYTAAMLAFAQLITPWTADGSLVRDDSGAVLGSIQVAQAFTRPDYFWPRPSAVDYNASATGGSNLSPTNPALTERAQELIARYGEEQSIPADLVSSSGSGIDPHITVEAAIYQIPRVSRHRSMSEETMHDLVADVAEYPSGIPVGGKVVNVLKLNMALDTLQGSSHG